MAPTKKLSRKQTEIHRLLMNKRTPKQIAEKLGISVNGVYGHMRRIEQNGVDLSAYRSRNGSPRKRQGRKPSPQSSNGDVLAHAKDEVASMTDRLMAEAEVVEKRIQADTLRLGEIGDFLKKLPT